MTMHFELPSIVKMTMHYLSYFYPSILILGCFQWRYQLSYKAFGHYIIFLKFKNPYT